MRTVAPVAVLVTILFASFACPSRAAIDTRPPDAQSIAALEAKASQAQPREQCFIYAELVHELIEFSSAQYAAGDIEKAALTLKRVNGFAQKIHIALTNDEKRLKNAQILLRHTANRLNELLHASAVEDRPLVADTLTQVNLVQTEAMMQVFRK